MSTFTRRSFAGALAAPFLAHAQSTKKFRISLAQWSLHRHIQGGKMTNLDFPKVARGFGISGLEFVNGLWAAPTAGYLRRLKGRMNDTNTECVLIMVDDEGLMGHSSATERQKAARNHHKWVDYTAELGGHSIRCNMFPEKQPTTPAEIETFVGYCADSFASLCEYGAKQKINILIENHGGTSSNPDVLVALMKKVNLPNFGLLPDFGNFPQGTDKYEAVRKMMPYAKGVSFKCHEFGPDGNETGIDMHRMMKIVDEAGYRGWVGIEFEGKGDEMEGIRAAKKFLDQYAS
jgi:L-ribulose-5-phosphate 3-epimerase